jgi:23S rRNA pseudouridine1911/1915/1917 synthase
VTPESVIGKPGRLDAVLAELTGIGRGDVQRAITAGRVTVDGSMRTKAYHLRGGERIDLEVTEPKPLQAEGPPIPVRYRDDDLLLIAKPAGLVTHPTERRRSGTVVNRLLGMGITLAPAGGSLRPGIVHRLDIGTSGLMVVAQSDDAYRALSAMVRRHELDRRYLVLARGVTDHETFGVDAPLGRRADRIQVDHTHGRAADTAFEVRERFPRATLLEAVPGTGRTHQIRVHLRAIGHPVLGDRRYGGGGDDATALGLTRPFLHSWRLSFRHPLTGETIAVEEPLPDDLAEALTRVRRMLRS